MLGPLVVAAIACEEDNLQCLKEIGVRDSKKLKASKRAELYETLASQFQYQVIKISPQELDSYRRKGGSLNELEGAKFAELINRLKPSKAYLDCADVSPSNFRRLVIKTLTHPCELIIEHKADDRYPIVGAASIIAKVERDRDIELLKEEYGEIGSGYPSDSKTIAFIETWYKEKHEFPSFVRKTWKTSSRVKNRKLLEF